MLTELGRSQVEVQRCSLSSEGPRLRSSGAQCAQTLAVEIQHCVRKLAKSLRRVGKAEVDMEVDAKVVEEKLEEREEEEKEVEDEEEEETEEENNCDKI